MTRKHFKIIAAEIKTIEDRDKAKFMCDFFCKLLPKFNPSFDENRFREACGF